MTKTDRVQVEGKTLDEAIAKAAQSLGVAETEVKYDIVRGGSNSLFSFFSGKRFEIQAWPRESQATPPQGKPERRSRRPSASPSDERPKAELSKGQMDDLQKELADFWQGICERMIGEKVEVSSHLSDSRLVLDADSEELINRLNRQGKLAEAFEHILRKKPRHLRQELPFRIFCRLQWGRVRREKPS